MSSGQELPFQECKPNAHKWSNLLDMQNLALRRSQRGGICPRLRAKNKSFPFPLARRQFALSQSKWPSHPNQLRPALVASSMPFEMRRLHSESGKSFPEYATRPPWGSSVDPNSAGSSERPCHLASSVLHGGRWWKEAQQCSPRKAPHIAT